MMTIAWLWLWLACGVVSYPLQRRFFRRSAGRWTVGCRRFAIACAILFGPINLAAGLLVLLLENNGEPADW